jgi:geranylgeranyl diphosphate synthase type I
MVGHCSGSTVEESADAARALRSILRAGLERARVCPDELQACLGRVTELVRALVDGNAHEPLASIVKSHLGSGGKQFRARLALLTARALGAEMERAVPWAAACELMHNASLVHDDLQDRDVVRRDRPTVWAQHGESQAINAGDLLLMLPYLAVDQPWVSPGLKFRLTQVLARRAAATVGGQALEEDLRRHGRAIWPLYERAAIGKTGQFFALPVEGAALLSGQTPDRAKALGEAMLLLGLLYQLRDDVVDLYGDKGRGETGNDIREGKISALVVAQLELDPSSAQHVLGVLGLGREHVTAAHVAELQSRFVRSGALEAVVARAEGLAVELAGKPVWRGAGALLRAVEGMAEGLLGPMRALGVAQRGHEAPELPWASSPSIMVS